MVLDFVPKHNALDDVFWMALFNMAIKPNKGDCHKFYDVLLPFLIGKPLEEAIVSAEKAEDNWKKGDNQDCGSFGDWRSPERSATSYVKVVVGGGWWWLVVVLLAHPVGSPCCIVVFGPLLLPLLPLPLRSHHPFSPPVLTTRSQLRAVFVGSVALHVEGDGVKPSACETSGSGVAHAIRTFFKIRSGPHAPGRKRFKSHSNGHESIELHGGETGRP